MNDRRGSKVGRLCGSLINSMAEAAAARDALPYRLGSDQRLHRTSCRYVTSLAQPLSQRAAEVVLDERDGVACHCLIEVAEPVTVEKKQADHAAPRVRQWLKERTPVLVNRRDPYEIDIIAVRCENGTWKEAGFAGRFPNHEAAPLVGILATEAKALSVLEADRRLEWGFERFLRNRVAPAEWGGARWMDERDNFTVYLP